MKIEIHGRQVEVDDNFKDMSEDEQHKVVDEIASSFGPITAAATAEKEGPSTLANLGGGAEATALAYGVGLPKAALSAAKNLFGGVPAAPPPAPTNIPGEDRWFGSANAINEKAKIIRRNNELAKRYPNFERVTPPEPPVSVGQRAVSGLENLRTSKPGKSFSTGYNAMDALQHAGEGPLSNVQAGASALAAAAPWVEKHLPGKLKNIAKGLQLGAPAANYVIDKFTGQPVPALEQKATGGAVQHFAGGKLATAAKIVGDVAKPLWEKHGYDKYKIAQDYPEIIAPILANDPKTGKEFLKKQLSLEALAVQKARIAAQKEINAGDYQPFFDVNQRYYADPTKYPLSGNTLTSAVPKKADTIAKYTALANDPESLARLRGAFEKAKDRPAAKDWYAMGQLEDAFIKELGPEEGRKQFKNRFADAMAATTGGADPNSNLMMAAYTNYQKNLGKEIPTTAADLPFPIGGRFVSGNMEQAKKLADVSEISPVTNPKRHNFSANFLGNRDVSTLDEQMSQLWDPKMMAPPTNAYGIYEAALAKEAKKAGVEPANFQDIAWAGAKDYPGKPMMQEINEMIERTHKITGAPKEEILKGFIRADKPMYGIGALGAGEAMNQDDAQSKKKGGKVKKGKKK
jgi:hypothetical protein